MRNDCTGQCIAGVIIAIIFGALFIWMLVLGYQTQTANFRVSAYVSYAMALVFLAIAKCAKWWGMGCSCGGMGHRHCCVPDETAKKKKKR